MDFGNFRWPWKRKKPANPRADRIRDLVEAIELSLEFQRVIHAGIKIGNPIILEVEANGYRVGAIVSGTDPVLEYLVNWAAGFRLAREGELEEIVNQIQGEADRADCDETIEVRTFGRFRRGGRN